MSASRALDRRSALHTPATVAAAAQLACLLEASAQKPGNVHPHASFHDTSYTDFLASAAAIGPAMLGAGEVSLGITVQRAIEATAAWTTANTNLGIVLLMAPLARAAITATPDQPLRECVAAQLAATTIADAASVYTAIRAAQPGGLGRIVEHDVGEEPRITLIDAMHLAADRDAIAREYDTRFAITFDIGAPAADRARSDGLSWSDAVIETFLTILARTPDTLIARKLGAEEAGRVSARAADVEAAGGVRTERGRAALDALDRALRDPLNRRNPGTTADLTAASIYVALLEGAWGGTR